MKTVNAATANREFSRMLREVAQGERFTVLSRGKPVATIQSANAAAEYRTGAKQALLKRLHAQPAGGRRDWSRDELYER